MSQSHQPYPPRAYSPLQQSSPHGSPYPLDHPKRPMFSPTGQSHYGPPAPSNIALPNQVFSSPYYGAQTNGSPHSATYPPTSPYGPHPHHSPYSSVNTHPPPLPSPVTQPPQQAQQTASAGTMGPPSRPTDKPTDINDLGDVLSGSGIDLREEEAAMYRTYGASHALEAPQPVPRPYPFVRDNFYSANIPGDRQNFYGAGNFVQPSTPFKSTEDIAEVERLKAIRRKEEIKQYHLNQPFLLTGNLRRRFDTERNKNHVRFDDSGLWTPRQNLPPREYRMVGPDGNEVLRVLQDESILQKDTALSEILALISLATEERLRILVEEAAVLARTRRVESLGLAPPELRENGTTREEPLNGLPTPSNSAVSPKANPLKRSYSEANKPITPISSQDQTPNSFTPPTNNVAHALQESAKKERALEEERLAKRQRRKNAATGDGNLTDTGSGPGTPGGTLGEVAPDVDIKKSGSKKAKGQADNATQAQQIAALNKTTQMALGGKQLSWMKKGPDSGPSNPYLARTGTTSQKTSNVPDGASQIPRTRNFGDFREDRDDGKGIQMRDLLSVLEEYGKEKKAVQKAYAQLIR